MRTRTLVSVVALNSLMFALPAVSSARDRDHDGMRDRWEKRHHVHRAKADPDRDRLVNRSEFRHRTKPHRKDTDRDGLRDGREVRRTHTNPRRKDTDRDGLRDGREVRRTHTNPRRKDTDRDGISDGREVRRYHTNPRRKDTDGDGVPDGREIRAGSDPRDPRSVPKRSAPGGGDPSLAEPPRPTPPAPPSVYATSASQLRSLVGNPAYWGKTIGVNGNVGGVNLSGLQPSRLVTIVPGAGGRLGNVVFQGSANVRVDGLWMSSVDVRPGSALNRNLQFTNCRMGGSDGARVSPQALLGVQHGSEDILVDGCELAWTSNGSQGGYAVRAVNGSAGPIRRLTIRRSRIHHIAADGLQVAGVQRLTLDRTEIAYVAADPGSDEHADSVQIMSLEGGARSQITNNYIHHVGFRDASDRPSDGTPAGQFLVHESWADDVDFVNNLIRENRNFVDLGRTAGSDGIHGWVIRRNTILRNGPPQPSKDNAIVLRAGGGNVLQNNVLSQFAGAPGTVSSASGNIVLRGSGPGAVLGSCAFDAAFACTNQAAGFRKPAGAPW